MKNPIKKGFTIIELAIVLSIISILAVVVVPQINATKFETKNRIVYDNVDIVYDYVAKILKNQGLKQNETLRDLMTADFNSSGGDNVINPFTNGTGIWFSYTSYGKLSDTSVAIVNRTAKTLSSKETITFNKSDAGVVVVECYKDGYVIQGVDGNGSVVKEYVVRNNYGTANYYIPPSPVDIKLSQSVDEVFNFLDELSRTGGGGLKNNQLARELEEYFSGDNAIVNPVTNATGVDYVPNLNKDTAGLALIVDNNDQYSIRNPNDTDEFKNKLDYYTLEKYRGMVVVISTKNGYIIGGINDNPEVIENIRVFLNGN